MRAYQEAGHEAADLDPLQLPWAEQHGIHDKTQLYRLDHKYYGFTDNDLDREFYLDSPQIQGLLGMKKTWKLRDLIDSLKIAYCQRIGVEYMHIFN